MKLIAKKEFARVVFDIDSETFVIYVAILNIKDTNMAVNPPWAAQILLLKANKSITVFAKHSDYTDVFLPKFIIKLLNHISINNDTIKLEDDKQLPYGPIYSLELVGLEALKTYIKINRVNVFIRLFKSLIETWIHFNCKSNGNFRLCVDYYGLNNLTIKSQYLLY